MDRGSQLRKDNEEDEEDEEEEERRTRQDEAEEEEEEKEEEKEEEEKEDEEATDIKSNNPHLAGGEKLLEFAATMLRKAALHKSSKKAWGVQSASGCRNPRTRLALSSVSGSTFSCSEQCRLPASPNQSHE